MMMMNIAIATETSDIQRLGLNKTKDQRSRAHQVCVKTGDFKSFAAKPIQSKKKQSSLPMKLSENPKSLAHEAGEILVCCKSVPVTARPLQMKQKHPPLKVSQKARALGKNATETLELFEIAKKSADVANAKGILLSKEETSICVDTLSLLISFPISSTAPETRRIMERLAYLTKHKDHKICNSASALLHHWRQSIRDQQLTKKMPVKLKDSYKSAKDKGRKLN